MTNYEVKYLRYKNKYDKLKNKLLNKINSDKKFKSLYNIFVNNYLYEDNKNILLKNNIDLNLIINELKFDLDNNNIKFNKKLDTILENDDL